MLRISQPLLSLPLTGSRASLGLERNKGLGEGLGWWVKYTTAVCFNKENITLRSWHCIWTPSSCLPCVYTYHGAAVKGGGAPTTLVLCLLCQHLPPRCTILASLQSICFSLLLDSTSAVSTTNLSFFTGVLWLKLCKEEKKIPLPQLCSGEYMLCLMTSGNQVKNTMIVTGDVYRSDSDLGLFGLWLTRGHHTGRNGSLVMNITQGMCCIWGPLFQCHRDSFTNLQDK